MLYVFFFVLQNNMQNFAAGFVDSVLVGHLQTAPTLIMFSQQCFQIPLVMFQVSCVAYSSNGVCLASGSLDGTADCSESKTRRFFLRKIRLLESQAISFEQSASQGPSVELAGAMLVIPKL